MTTENSERVTKLEQALDTLVTELVRHRFRPDQEPVSLEAVPFDMLGPDAMWEGSAAVKDPIDWALKRGIKTIGKLLYAEVKSTDALRDIAERVAENDPAQWGQRISPIDDAWNGVGEGDDMWWS